MRSRPNSPQPARRRKRLPSTSSTLDAADQIERALSDRGLYCDVLVNSAGFGVFGPAAKAAPGEQLDLVDVNIRALTELTLRFLPAMVARGRGGVLNWVRSPATSPGRTWRPITHRKHT